MQDDYMTIEDLAFEDDRDDRDDRPTQSYYDGDHCEHGVYVGGCGIDWVCQWCEDGVSAAEVKRIYAARQLREVRERADRAALMLAKLLEAGMGGVDAAYLTQRSSYIGNPLTRYGRH
jgi:hypothetical protein